MKHKASVANPAFDLLPRCCWSALHLLLRGRIADLVPFWWVAFNVALAQLMPIANLSADASTETLLCLLLEVQDCLEGKSTKVSLQPDLETCGFTLLRLANKIAQGQMSNEFTSGDSPGLVDDWLKEISFGLRSVFEVGWM